MLLQHTLAGRNAASTHRQRLMDGMIRCLEQQGYESTTIADIAAAAHVSKRTFYEHFTSKQDCLVALYDRGLQEVLDRMRSAGEHTPPDGDRVEACVRALFEHFALNATRSKAVLLGVMGLGEYGLKLRKQGQHELILVLAKHAGVDLEKLPPMFMEGMMGIVSEWTLFAFATDTTGNLPHQAAPAALLIRAGLEKIQSDSWGENQDRRISPTVPSAG